MNEEVIAKLTEAQASIQAALDALQNTGEAATTEPKAGGLETKGRGDMAGMLGIGG